MDGQFERISCSSFCSSTPCSCWFRVSSLFIFSKLLLLFDCLYYFHSRDHWQILQIFILSNFKQINELLFLLKCFRGTYGFIFFLMFPFDPPENIRKSLVCLCFQRGQKLTLFSHCFLLIPLKTSEKQRFSFKGIKKEHREEKD